MCIIQILVHQPQSLDVNLLIQDVGDNPPASFTDENVNVDSPFWFLTMPISFTILPLKRHNVWNPFPLFLRQFANLPLLPAISHPLPWRRNRAISHEAENGLQGALKDATSKLNLDVEVEGRDVVFINALGMGARKLVGDEKMYPTRGQTVFVEGEAKDITIRTGKWGVAYVIPWKGSGYTLLGWSQEVGNWYID
jgi:hypothetical protein